jgi:hypothetical protein
MNLFNKGTKVSSPYSSNYVYKDSIDFTYLVFVKLSKYVHTAQSFQRHGLEVIRPFSSNYGFRIGIPIMYNFSGNIVKISKNVYSTGPQVISPFSSHTAFCCMLGVHMQLSAIIFYNPSRDSTLKKRGLGPVQ